MPPGCGIFSINKTFAPRVVRRDRGNAAGRAVADDDDIDFFVPMVLILLPFVGPSLEIFRSIVIVLIAHNLS